MSRPHATATRVVGLVAAAHLLGLWALTSSAPRRQERAPVTWMQLDLVAAAAPAAPMATTPSTASRPARHDAAPSAAPAAPAAREPLAPAVPRHGTTPPSARPAVIAAPLDPADDTTATPAGPQRPADPTARATDALAPPATGAPARSEAALSAPAQTAAPAPAWVPASAVAYRVPPPIAVPLVSRRLGESGTVWLRVRVGRDGLPLQVALHRSSGHDRLDQQAIDAMRAARFQPQTENGQPIEWQVIAPLQYDLD